MAGAVRFVLDGIVRELADVAPTLTVLEWLRAERRCGTKEGCAEGDCGACTVVLGELAEQTMRYRAVNACILFVPTLDGKELITVESLAGPGEALHPVQQALVDHHGSQCGFCTPGFVMSLFALYRGGKPVSRQRIDDALAGNLCRCTGYRPIVAAAEAACGGPPCDTFVATEAARIAVLRSLQRDATLTIVHGGQRFLAPRTTAALAELYLQYPDAVLLGGGTDVGLWVTKQHRDLATIIFLGDVDEMRSIVIGDEAIEIGAVTPYVDARAALAAHYPDFGELLRRLGCEQIRNIGTIGGNIANASPIGDTPPLLMAVGASLVLRRGDERREIRVEEFFLGYRKTALQPGEFIERIRLPLPRPGWHFRAYKISKRFDQDISAVCGAFAVKLEAGTVADVRLCYGGIAATPKRVRDCEAALVGGAWTAAAVTSALPKLDAEITPISDMRASERYRRLIAANLLRKFQLETSIDGALGARTRVLEGAEAVL